ncbi:MAG: FAD:protein FMN transferase [Planctomycetaceae bacterium]
MNDDSPTHRRDFLTRVIPTSSLAESNIENSSASVERAIPSARDTIRLGARAMACDFTVIMNPGSSSRLVAASTALDLVGELEEQLSVYRESSEISQLNRRAAQLPVSVQQNLFDLLCRSRDISLELSGAFDPTTGPLIRLWKRCQEEHRLPTDAELEAVRSLIGMHHIQFNPENISVKYDQPGVELNLGANGKGYAVDRAGAVLTDDGITDWLIHGGHSSILANGNHTGYQGWPIGLRNPLFPRELWATILLQNLAMGTSGSGVQFYRIQGNRYNHIINPQTGWPVEGQLSVSVFAPTAELADALSTAFFVIGVEKSRQYCNNHPEIGAILTPAPEHGRKLSPVICNIPPEILFFHDQN